MRAFTLLLLLLSLPGLLGAQEMGRSPEPTRAEGTAFFLVQGSSLAGARRVFLGGGAGLVFGGRWTIAGTGLTLTENVELAGSGASTGFDLKLGYGGLTFRYAHPLASRVDLEGGLLVGAGHAVVGDLITGTEVGSDNFPLMEPEVALSIRLRSWLTIGASGGYRMAWGVEDLPRVSQEDLRSFTGSLHLRVGGR
jgi:hypothetical protein